MEREYDEKDRVPSHKNTEVQGCFTPKNKAMKLTHTCMLTFAVTLAAASSVLAQSPTRDLEEMNGIISAEEIAGRNQEVQAQASASGPVDTPVPVTYDATINGEAITVLKDGDGVLPGPGEQVDERVTADQNCGLVLIVRLSDNTSRFVDQYAYEAALAKQPVYGCALPPIDMAPFTPAVSTPPPDVPPVVIRWYNQAHVATNQQTPAEPAEENRWLVVTAVD